MALLLGLLFSATPQQAALRAVGSPPQKAIVRRVNITGRYAAVLTSGGIMEGAPVKAPVLVKRFPAGWQAVEVLNFRCRLVTQVASGAVRRTLMIGMPSMQSDPACPGEPHDSGPTADVVEVRRLMGGPLVPFVTVSGDWTLGEWYGAGGGEDLFHRVGRNWRVVAGGGGAMGVHEMKKYGVPRSVWCVFGIYDAPCKKKR